MALMDSASWANSGSSWVRTGIGGVEVAGGDAAGGGHGGRRRAGEPAGQGRGHQGRRGQGDDPDQTEVAEAVGRVVDLAGDRPGRA